MELTVKQIKEMSIRQINKYFRDEYSWEMFKWPVNGRFNPVDRAINRLQKRRREGLVLNPGLEYFVALDREISDIVNSLV